MSSDTQGPSPQSAPVESPVALEIDADPTLGYASIQNSVPVLRGVRITNAGEVALENLEIGISCNPRFAQSKKFRFDKLAPQETRHITPVDLAPDHDYLATLQEAVNATLRVSVAAAGKELGSATHTLEVLAYDQWAGTRGLPELLAAFCMPNNPAVDVLLGNASKLLRSQYPDRSMDGYQTKRRDNVWQQVSAIYSAICAEDLQYSEPPASFGTDGQRLRMADRILEGRVATCLDLAMLFASCFEQAGLRPVVLFKEGHAWVGVWLHQTCFSDPLTDDVQAIRKRVETGEFIVFETTGVAHHPSNRPSLRIAMEQGANHLLDEASFRYAVDIHRARELQIKPVPSRAATIKRNTEQAEAPSPIEPTPQLPPFEPEYLSPEQLPAEETPEGRLSNWKSRLLDLTLRNRLINFKPTKATLQFVAPDVARLEDYLSEGVEFRIRPLPAIMEGSDPRMAAVHTARAGRTPLEDTALEALAGHELIAKVAQDEVDARLLTVFSAARTGLEEGGANTLYLSIGMLRWAEPAGEFVTHLAPILLVPVSLQRQSVRSGFRLSRHDDETIINPTLLEHLKQAFEMRIPGLDALPTDDSGVDVARILQTFRLAVREIPKWEVLDEAHLGIFSFTKYLMWKDLQDRADQLKENRVVEHLISHPGEAFVYEHDGQEPKRLDDVYHPRDLLTPLLADSSQLEAISAVNAGRDLVLEGPPGTGKSQTITNLIAHSLAKGKSVLFVSEKMAALEVVQRRLEDIGLGPFCLELHSSKAKKSEVVQKLAQSLDFGAIHSPEEWSREAERLATLRQQLNGFVDALHRIHPVGLTVYDAIGSSIANAAKPPAALSWPDPLAHTRDDLERMRATARKISALAEPIGDLKGHALAPIGATTWSPTWQDKLVAATQALELATENLKKKARALGFLIKYPTVGASVATYEALDRLCDGLLAAPTVPIGLARAAHDGSARARIQVLAKHGTARNLHWDKLGSGWKASLAKLNAAELQAAWDIAIGAWWPKSWLATRSVSKRLSAFREDRKRLAKDSVPELLAILADVNSEDDALRAMEAEAEALLQEEYSGPGTEWSAITRHERWARQFAESVIQVTGGAEVETAALRTALQPLVTDERSLLVPEQTAGRSLVEYREAWRAFGQRLAELSNLVTPSQDLEGARDAGGALERILGMVSGWRAAIHQLPAWCQWRRVREEAIGFGLQSLVESVETGAVPFKQVAEHFEYSYRNWWLKKTIDIEPVLRDFSSADHTRKIREFREVDLRFQELTKQQIVAVLSGRVPSVAPGVASGDSEMGRLLRERNRQRGHMPIRKLVRALPTLLPRLKPCLLMSPLSVAQYLDAGYAQFDLVVFDEASQIPVWDAVGAIARGKQLVVVGDPKQLPPTSFFAKSVDTDDDRGGDESVRDLESILDECLGVGLNRMSLKWHYRSRHESLITFSNQTYYGGGLVTFPSPVTDDVAVRFERVYGTYDRGGSRTNRSEAEAVVKAIRDFYLDKKRQHLSLGVVTFNQPQQSLIETLLDAKLRGEPALDGAMSAGVRQEPLFIKNLENVQGDERDVIFFSVTYGVDGAGKVSMNFGPLNGEGGHRRLNVATTRAREGVVIFSTLMPEQVDLARVRAAGVRDLKHYLEFAQKGPRALVEQSNPTGLEPDSPFEVAVIQALRERGWDVHPQIGCSGYRIDIGVVDPRAPGRYLAGIECDGRSYHSAATARDRDRLRQHILEGLGWRIHRIWSTDWWLNPKGEVERIHRRLDELLTEESADEEHEDAEDPPVDVTDASEAQAPTKTTHHTSATELPAYRVASIQKGEDAAEFYEPSANRVLREQLVEVIKVEGPIPDELLFRRIARAWSLERTGARIVERLRGLVPRDVVTTKEGRGVFFWPPGADPGTWDSFRVCDGSDANRRRLDEVCLEELGAAILHLLRNNGSAPLGDIARSVSRLLGIGRTSRDAEERIGKAVQKLIQRGVVLERDSRLFPAK